MPNHPPPAAPAAKICFMGTPELAAVHLQKLLDVGLVPTLVITQPDRPAGRGSHLHAPEVKVVAQAAGIEVWQPERIRQTAVIDEFAGHRFDINLVVSYGQILTPRMLDAPRLGSFNIHTSLLPRWRGAAPIEWALLAGDEVTGVTVQRMTRGLDEGPIVAVRELAIRPIDDKASLFERLATLGAELLAETVPAILAGTHTETPQPTVGVTVARKIEPADGHLDFSEPAAVLWGRIRATTPRPGAWVMAHFSDGRSHRLKITAAHAFAEPADMPIPRPPAGTLLHPLSSTDAPAGEGVVVAGEGVLHVLEVQPESKRPMPIKSYLNGHPVTHFSPLP